MRHFTFYRESNNFDDILNDVALKKKIHFKIRWSNHLEIGINHYSDEGLITYIELKYGESIIRLTKDYSPIPNIDYIPIRR
jgi:hypothetical protein